jgi:preprotein translocase subunit SecF
MVWRIKEQIMLNILGKRYFFFLISLAIILPGLIVMAIYGMPLAIDFKGGNMLVVKFSDGTAPQPADVVQLLATLGITDAQIQSTGVEGGQNNGLSIRTPYLDQQQSIQMKQTLQTAYPTLVLPPIREDNVGPTIGKETTRNAAIAISVAALGVILFITFAFRGIQHAFRYGVCAIIAMTHDVLVVISISAIGGHYFGWQIDSLFLTALLTVIGFSVQDKVVVFDRIRENSGLYRKLSFEKLANHSVVQTLQRSINTQLMTSEFMLLALALFGGVTLREFATILLIGLFMGTYSSIFIAATVLVLWENQEWKTWFKGRPANAT